MTRVKQDAKIVITLTRSPIGQPARQRTCLRNLGLRRIRHAVTCPGNPQVWGLVDKVKHLVEVREA